MHDLLHRFFRRSLLAAAFLAPAASFAQALDPKDALIDKVLQLSGVVATINQLPDTIDAQISQKVAESPKPIPPERVEEFRSMMQNAFAPQELYVDLFHEMRKRFKQPLAEDFVGLASAPLARRITSLEVSSMSASGVAAISAYAANLESSPPAQSRLQLLSDLERTHRAVDRQLDMLAAIIQQIGRTFPAAQGRLPSVSQIRQRMRPHVAEQFMVGALYTYQSITDDELRQYIAMNKQPSARWAVGSIIAGVQKAMLAAFQRFQNSLIAKYPQQRGVRS